MNKRLKTDAEGIPHRSLDSFQRSPRQSHSLKAPYSSFNSYESTPPSASPPKPPRTYSSNGDQSRGSPNSTGSQQQRETEFYRNQSLSSSNTSRGSTTYNKPTSSLPVGSTFSMTFNVSTAKEQRRTPPPPPPPRPSPGSQHHMTYDDDMHGPRTEVSVHVLCNQKD